VDWRILVFYPEPEASDKIHQYPPIHVKTQNTFWLALYIQDSNMTSFFRFVDKRAIYRWYNLIRTCDGECDWLFHWQYKLCATFSASVNINYRLPIKVYYRICTLRHIRIEINHGSQNVKNGMQFRSRCNIFNSFGNALLFRYIYKGRLVKISEFFFYCIFILQRNLHDIFDAIL
jgi:hypothetical protein